jgi:hypothetical protein
MIVLSMQMVRMRAVVRTLIAASLLLLPVLMAFDSVRAAMRTPAGSDGPEYLYVWASVMEVTDPPATTPRRAVALLAIDLRRDSPTRGEVVSAVVADTAGRVAHHTEHALAADGILFANDFGSGRTHRFDLSSPGAPRLLGTFTTAGPFAYPHSFARLPDGTVLATYQWQGPRKPPGGLAQLSREGVALRWAHAAVEGVDDIQVQPYSLEPVPDLDRVVTTNTSMVSDAGVHVQIWRLSDLALLHTLEVPAAPSHEGHDNTEAGHVHSPEHHLLPGEPRLLADGRTVMFGTFKCGLYTLTGIDGDAPRIEFVHAFPGTECAVPVRIGRWWIQTVPVPRALVALDVSAPHQPREVSRITFDQRAPPHWLAADDTGEWIAMTSSNPLDARIHLVAFDTRTGVLSRPDLATIDVSRVDVPGFGTARLMPHGAVFSRVSRP